MSKTDIFQTKITFQTPSHDGFSITQGECTLQHWDKELSGLQLVISVDWDAYCQLQQMRLFHLTPDVYGSMEHGQFQESSVQLQIMLQPECLPQLDADTLESQTVVQTLFQLSQQEPDHPLLKTENWYLQAVNQSQVSGDVGYRTLWDYVEPAALRSDFKPDANFFESVNQFVQNSKANQDLLAQEGQGLNKDLLGQVSQLCQSLIDISSSSQFSDEAIIDQLMAGMTNLVKASLGISVNLPVAEADAVSAAQHKLTSEQTTTAKPQSLFTTVTAFFLQEEWAIEHNRAKQVLRMPFEGDNGSWQCFAKTREDTREFIFYSMAPFKVPEHKRLAIAEYICRANYGLVLGNLELDLSDGEVRYKTSIDVENSVLSLDLVKNMVHSNIHTFDRYLPGLTAILNQDILPVDAIALVEAV
ncbi:MAG: YbjN domain-containing protein [Leptolyngbyaceae cyanobacterium MAG.088]|nr:YbjN domain-containing protein [Leptolyngbyaceae cyanobacterium MAG.088]